MTLNASLGSNALNANIGPESDIGSMQYRYFTDGTYDYRQGVRNGKFYLDKTITSLGFDGVENVDWEYLEESE